MRLKKTFTLFVFSIFGGTILLCQTNPHLSFYRYNWQLANAAAIDKSLILKDKLIYAANVTWRQQWDNIEGAPRLGTASFEYRADPKYSNYRLGVNTVFDNTHAIGTSGAYFNYTYFTKIGQGHVIQAGLNAGVIWYRVDANKLKFANQNISDPTSVGQSASFFEVGAGVVYRYQEYFYAGLSTPQLGVLNLAGTSSIGYDAGERMKNVPIYLLLGGIVELRNDDWSLEPSGWFRYIPGVRYTTIISSPFSIDLDLRLNTPFDFWFSGGTGTNKSVRVGFGFMPSFRPRQTMQTKNNLDIGLVYEFSYDEVIVSFGQTIELSAKVVFK
jgi:type IX secretion system PorP/SprF family membrane protein